MLRSLQFLIIAASINQYELNCSNNVRKLNSIDFVEAQSKIEQFNWRVPKANIHHSQMISFDVGVVGVVVIVDEGHAITDNWWILPCYPWLQVQHADNLELHS